MSGTVLGLFVLGLVAGAGLLLASAVHVRGTARLLVATYVIAFGLVVGLCLLLSIFGDMTRTALVVGSAAILAAIAGARLLLGGAVRPFVASDKLHSLARTRPLLVLGAAVGSAVAYVLALILSTPPNGWDQLNYHLARAAFWAQSGIGYIGSAYDQRLNIYPPDGEIPFSFVLGVTHDENLTALAQLIAAFACAIGVFALAQRFDLTPPEAAFGALLFLALPIVLLQSATTKNDLIVASLLVGAAVFVLGDSRREIALAALATALAMGAKFTAGYGLVLLFALAVTARPRELRSWRILGLATGALLGSYWYVVNAIEGEGFLGDRSGIPGLTSLLAPRENVVAAVGLLVDWLDLSGAEGADIFLYLIAAVAVTSSLALATRRRREPWLRSAVPAGLLVASPLAIWVLTTKIGRPALVSLRDAVGASHAFLAEGAPASSPTSASDTGSWFGPVGILFVVGTAVMAIVLARRRRIDRPAFVAGIAPLVWFLLVALSLTYHPWQGRFFIFPVALSASLWGLALRVAPVAWGAVALSVTTALLSLVHYAEKPSGVRLLDRSSTTSVWSMARSQVQSLHDPALEPVFRFLDEQVPADAAIALALGTNDFGYPAFGPHLARHVLLVPFGSNARDLAADWLYANPERAGEIDRSCWLEALSADSGVVFRRRPGGCAR